VRYLLDATGSSGEAKLRDLDRARDAFVEATAAARSHLQQAVAERYLLLTLLGLGRRDAVSASLIRVEDYATANAFDALRTSEFNQEAAEAVVRRDGDSGRQTAERLNRARYQVKQTALEAIGMSARLLAEMAVLRPTLGLPPVVAPPIEPLVDNTVMTVSVKIKGNSTTIENRGETTGAAYWAFEVVTPPYPLHLGSLTISVSPEPAPMARAQPVRSALRPAAVEAGHVRVEARTPLPVALSVESMPTARTSPDALDVHHQLLPAGQTLAVAPLRPSPEGFSWVRITPQYIQRALIEVACRADTVRR